VELLFQEVAARTGQGVEVQDRQTGQTLALVG